MRQIEIFDTTLRDGEQSAGVTLTVAEKVEIAHQLAKLGVNVIEAGFPLASPTDFQGVFQVAQQVRGVTVAGLARARAKDIEAAWEALRPAEQPRIHTFIGTSPVHMRYKLKATPAEILERAVQAVRLAKSKVSDVEFSAEDSSRSDPDFLAEVFAAVIKAGATVITISDVVGYITPDEFSALVRGVREKTAGIEKVKVSVHCHDDLGLAVANTMAGLTAGADQLECTVNGIGDRAGNAALEELAMILHTRRDLYPLTTSIVTTEIMRTSRLVSRLTGMPVQYHKAIVGRNAFAHEAGVHQDGILKEPSTYQIMTPSDVGWEEDHSSLVLGRHSGRHAVRRHLGQWGITLDEASFETLFARFKQYADGKQNISKEDMLSLLRAEEESQG
jgi:2-isopropylmalate synthase